MFECEVFYKQACRVEFMSFNDGLGALNFLVGGMLLLKFQTSKDCQVVWRLYRVEVV